MEKVDVTLFLKRKGNDLQIYGDDIIVGATDESLCEVLANLMKNEFEMSMMSELTFFLRLY